MSILAVGGHVEGRSEFVVVVPPFAVFDDAPASCTIAGVYCTFLGQGLGLHALLCFLLALY